MLLFRSKIILDRYEVWGTSEVHSWPIITFILYYVTPRTVVLNS